MSWFRRSLSVVLIALLVTSIPLGYHASANDEQPVEPPHAATPAGEHEAGESPDGDLIVDQATPPAPVETVAPNSNDEQTEFDLADATPVVTPDPDEATPSATPEERDPYVVLDRTRATVASYIGYTVHDFPANSTVYTAWRDPNGILHQWETFQVDEDGYGFNSFAVPAAPGDLDHEILFTAGDETVSAAFEIAPRISPSVTTVQVGDPFTVNLRGFSARDVIDLLWMHPSGAWVLIGEATTSSTGSVTNYSITTPYWIEGGPQKTRAEGRINQNTNAVSALAPGESVDPTRTTVNSYVRVTVWNYPRNAVVQVILDRGSGGPVLGTINTDALGNASERFRFPATEGGNDLMIGFNALVDDDFYRTVPFELAPRVKSTTNPGVRGEQANISLRGFIKREPIRIRWKNPATNSWVVVGTGVTSNTGSANIMVTVPAWAADGNHSVRAETPSFNAQTNVVFIQGGTMLTPSSLNLNDQSDSQAHAQPKWWQAAMPSAGGSARVQQPLARTPKSRRLGAVSH